MDYSRCTFPKPGTKKKKCEQTKACDISANVKKKVWERDGECCILCGSPQAMPNAHYIPRSQGGLGIEQNTVTLCIKCHHDYDNGGMRIEYGQAIRDYLKNNYKNWKEENLRYKKGE